MQPLTTVDERHPAVGSRVDALLGKPVSELEQMYANGKVPAIDAPRGDLRGRMLAWTILPSLANQLLKVFAGSDAFPWRGKSFQPLNPEQGEGVNRVFTDRLHLFRFGTSIGPSRGGPFDAFQLDYDRPGNPGLIRKIKDEIREIEPGLYLGQAYMMIRGRPKLILYFALEG